MSRIVNIIAAITGAAVLLPAQTHKTTHIIWVMTDGLRWQEVFSGPEAALMTKANGVPDPELLRKAFPNREALMPFLWNTIAKQGQVYGNKLKGSEASVTNGFNVSYPGYNESLTGVADPRITGNDRKYNPNDTVLEWLSEIPAFHDKIAAFAAWDLFPFIFNAPHAGFTVNAGFDPLEGFPGNQIIATLNTLKADSPRDWDDEPYDNLTFRTALEYLKQRKPRVLYLSLGETDDWAHAGKYGEYLRSTQRVDNDLKVLWETVQSIQEYRGATTLIFSTDHGRGEGEAWKGHGAKIPESRYIWMAFLGPDTQPLGERTNVSTVTQNRIAATLAALLGEDYHSTVLSSGAPIADVLAPKK